MRVKSEAKRNEIVRVAADLFELNGYERTSMSMISERLGGSKQTLYNYFSSKDELLRAVLDYDVGRAADEAIELLRAEKTVRKALFRLALFYLEAQLAPFAVSNMRLVASQPPSSKLGEEFYRNILCAAWQRIADEFKNLMRDGKLRRADSWAAAMHFKGLVLQDLLERQLLGAGTADEDEIENAARAGADAFLKIYGA